MTYKPLAIILIFTIFSTSLQAQIDFDLRKFKLPDLKRHALESNGKLDLNSNVELFGLKETSGIVSLVSSYIFYKNNKDRQQQGKVDCLFSINSAKDLRFDANFDVENRYYFRPNKFFEFDYIGWVSYYNGVPNQTLLKKQDVNLTVPVKYGWGRIEQVQDAKQAVNMLNELKKQQRIDMEGSDEEVIELANLIAKIKNKRFFDSRIRLNYELETLDSFFRAKDNVVLSDARYFTTLSDFWINGFDPIRANGQRLSLGLYPNFQRSNREFKGRNSFPNTTIQPNKLVFAYLLMLSPTIEYKLSRPLSLKWQTTNELSLGYGLGKYNSKRNGVVKNFNISQLQFFFSHTLGFYPNTRTIIEMNISANYHRFLNKYVGEEPINNDTLKGDYYLLSTSISGYYYLSRNLRFSIRQTLRARSYVSNEFDVIDWQGNLKNLEFSFLDFNNTRSNQFIAKSVLSSTFDLSLTYLFY